MSASLREYGVLRTGLVAGAAPAGSAHYPCQFASPLLNASLTIRHPRSRAWELA